MTKTAKTNTIVINPVTRIEGHGKIAVHLDEKGNVVNARFQITQFRGFEAFCRGKDFRDMVTITPRICGICPVSHHLAAAKACDAIMGVTITSTASKLRELMHMAQFIQSHALSFFHLSSPDLLFGFDGDPAIRNVVGVARKFPELAQRGILMRKFGQEIIKILGGKKIHMRHSIPGGVTRGLLPTERDEILKEIPTQKVAIRKTIDLVRNYLEKHAEEARNFATMKTAYMGLVGKDGLFQLYDGEMRLRDPMGRITDQFPANRYHRYIGEHVEPWSYLKFPFYLPFGFPDGSYRVGPLGRLNACDDFSTPEASRELTRFRTYGDNGMVHFTMYYHYARLLEILYCLERAEVLLNDPDITGKDLHVSSSDLNPEGIGVIEAPRGTLIHHYQINEDGSLKNVNLIVATGHNNYAMNRGIEMVARELIHGTDVKEGTLNQMEHVIRCYDPCLSCSTHAVGRMPLSVSLIAPDGTIIGEIRKN